tara:strand:- start:204 stop:1697 length:1494 start_codon:yes stop_codon:yes gene_type:complete
MEFKFTQEEHQNIIDNSRIGLKGYTIPKEFLSNKTLDFLYKNLFVKPFVNVKVAGGEASTGFHCYRENDKKIYIPRFFGSKLFGIPKLCDLTIQNTHNLKFVKTLRDYQINIVNTYIDYVTNDTNGGGAILEVPCGRGKTVMALDIISKLKQKTIIIVHKEFLMNQWIERIEEFLPDARVGKIQGPVFDVEDKDIVIGMLQTLYIKDYGSKAFSQFGLTIIDEVHRIGSEQFSKALFKVVTPYMLGISATVERKDRLTNVLYMFIGERIYHEDRDKDEKVIVRGIKFETNDSEYNTTDYDFRGNPKYSTMISKVCNYGPRSDFIVKTLSDLFIENPLKQIMVLAHNRSLLVYLHDAIINKDFATCGYYIGGMKQRDLEESESKQIVLATYAMAAEALDIKTLSTLVMASPKTDITQSVGRILRVKDNNPIVIDIIDSHDHFGNQWNTRKKFYKKNGYFIQSVSSKNYTDMQTSEWKTLYDPDNSSKQDNQRKCLLKF